MEGGVSLPKQRRHHPGGWDVANFAGVSSTAATSRWTFTFTDTSGTGSAFAGNGSKLIIQNGSHTEMLTLGQLRGSNLFPGFRNYTDRFAGIDNITISTTAPIPEPAGMVLLSVTMLGLGLRRRR